MSAIEILVGLHVRAHCTGLSQKSQRTPETAVVLPTVLSVVRKKVEVWVRGRGRSMMTSDNLQDNEFVNSFYFCHCNVRNLENKL
jgi:hypothetical protein